MNLIVSFRNTGDKVHIFIAGASIWEPGSSFDSSYEDFEQEITLGPGEENFALWKYRVEIIGDWAYQFAIWEEKPFIEENCLAR